MGMKWSIVMAVIAGTATLGGCAGGGGGMSSTPPPNMPAPPFMPTGCCGGDTGVTGPLAAPLPASFGSSPVPPQLASPGGPNFGTPAGMNSTNATFPLLFSSLQAGPGGLVPLQPGQGATITVNSPSIAPQGGAVSWQISVPAANVNDGGWEAAGLVGNFDAPIQALSYVALGFWINSGQSSPPVENFTHFVFGYETPVASMPVSGTAAFTGNAQAQVFAPIGPTAQYNWVEGNASFSVDFASGKISGALNEFGYIGASNVRELWNDVSVSAAIAAGSNRFGGTTAVTASPASSFSLKPSATGSINGAFFGPAAQQLGAVWTLSDGTISALGSVTASH